MGVDITTIDYLRVLIIEIGSTIILMVAGIPGCMFHATGADIVVKNLTSLSSPCRRSLTHHPKNARSREIA